MGFAGNLRTLSLAEVFQTLNRIQTTGVLRIARENGAREICFLKGEIIGVSAPEGSEATALLRRLLMEGRLDAEQVARISSNGRESQVVSALVERGFVKADDIELARRRQAEDEVCDIATWNSGDFVFHDIGPEAPDVNATIERATARPLRLVINALLMESARRQDEYQRIEARIPDDRSVLGPSHGGENRLKLYAQGYPQLAVVPLIDGVRTLEDIVRDSVATRLDVFTVVVELLDKEMIVALSFDDIIFHADYLFKLGENERAGRLYRRALEERPDHVESGSRLAECIEAQGDVPEAAANYGQLALGRLGSGDREQAVFYAEKAVSLAPGDQRLRMGLVRCLIAAERMEPAVAVLHEVAKEQQANGQLDDAHGSLLKILELSPEDETARRELARIFSSADDDDSSEDVVVCVSCGHVNHREAASCEQCQTLLHLTCMSCNRVVAASDRLCIFCGAYPHGNEGRRRAGGSPATSRIVDPSRVRAAIGLPNFRNQLEKLIHTARAMEEGGDLQNALEHWREVAKIQIDSPELVRHIKDLEGRIHDHFIEQQIEQGHQFKRIRRYWRATSAYRGALKAMTSDDPRVPRLVAILHSTQKAHYIACAVYASALLVFIVVAVIALRPRFILNEVREQAEELVAVIPGASDTNALSDYDARIQVLESRAMGYSDTAPAVNARSQLAAARAALQQRRRQLFITDVTKIDQYLKTGKIEGARTALTNAERTWKLSDEQPELQRLKQDYNKLRDQQLSSEELMKQGPQRQAEAMAQEKAGSLEVALVAYAALANHPNVAIASDAQASVARLEGRRQEFRTVFNTAVGLAKTDLAQALIRLGALEKDAQAWAQSEKLATAKAQVETRIAAAQRAWQQVSEQPTVAQLEAFIAEHPSAVQRVSAQQRLQNLRQQLVIRDRAIAQHQLLITDKQWDKAWASARELRKQYGEALPGASVSVPLWIETIPVGARVSVVDSTIPSTELITPGVMLVPSDAIVGTLVITNPGCETIRRPLTEVLTADWKLQVGLSRLLRWRVELTKSPNLIDVGATAVRVVAGDVLAEYDIQGREHFRTALGGDDVGMNRTRMTHVPTVIDAKTSVIGLPGHSIDWIGSDGVSKGRWATAGQVRGRPVTYRNELMGPGQRIAAAADVLCFGELGKDPVRIALARPAMTGPIAAINDLDRILCVITENGELIGIEESTKRVAFKQDLKISEAGQMIPLANNSFAVLLDGQRLAGFQIRRDGVQNMWSQPLAVSAQEDAVLVGSMVLISAGKQVIRINAAGVPQPPLALPEAATSAPAGAGDRIAVGCGRQVHVFQGGKPAWISVVTSTVTAVGVHADGTVVVGCEDGSLRAFAP